LTEKKNKKKAAALKYSKENLEVPVIAAYGSGDIAEKILKVARYNNIEIVENDEFFDFEELFEIGGEIPPEIYKIVVDILTYIIKTNKEEI